MPLVLLVLNKDTGVCEIHSFMLFLLLSPLYLLLLIRLCYMDHMWIFFYVYTCRYWIF